MCAGCPHRASQFIIKTVCDKIKLETGVDPIRPGDIGCNCLAVNPPLNAVDLSTCMGGGFDLSNGIARATDVPIVAHLGDSTFFHSGMAPMVNAVYNNAKITMIVLDNLTTAMTGAQPSPASGNNLAGAGSAPIHPEDIAKACGIKMVETLDPQDLAHSMEVLEKAIKFKGPSFVVFRRACAILEQREKKARGEKSIPYRIAEEKCISQSPPYCTAACPLHIDVRGYVRLVGEGRYDAALNLIQEKLPFAGIMGRICTRPCQSQCKRGELDESIEIAALKRAAVDVGHSDDNYLKIDQERNQKVAVIGSGPAGLMAAYDLRKVGYKVTIFEAAAELGGLLIEGIPEYRLPVEVVRQEIGNILKTGIEVKLNTRLGRDIQLDTLRKQYKAVFLAVGAGKANPLTIDNKVVSGAIEGLDFLREVRLGKKTNPGKKAVIIGGGNVAVDCARTCLRSGCREVTLVYRRDRPQMPAIDKEVNDAEKEGIKLELLAAPQAILISGKTVTGLECLRMGLGSHFVIEADMIIAAVGEYPDIDFLKQTDPKLINKIGLITADPLTLATSLPCVFAGGDAVSGPATVIDALAAGRKAAISIDRYINGKPLESGREGEGTQSSPLKVEVEGLEKQPAAVMPELPIDARRFGMREVELGFTADQASIEASRCLACGCQVCLKKTGCPAISVVEDEVKIDDSQCPGCGLCAQLCPTEAIIQ
jgi:NADPH-dependent glutamate synthase beta subunit-like oxidoreductase